VKGAAMAGFVQIVQFTTTNIDAIEEIADRMREELGDDFKVTKSTVSEDRERPGYYMIIAEFDSYDEAMSQSNDPRMGKFSEEMAALVDGPIKFYNLDVKFST
jgi:quinol monooxygenase YgiN